MHTPWVEGAFRWHQCWPSCDLEPSTPDPSTGNMGISWYTASTDNMMRIMRHSWNPWCTVKLWSLKQPAETTSYSMFFKRLLLCSDSTMLYPYLTLQFDTVISAMSCCDFMIYGLMSGLSRHWVIYNTAFATMLFYGWIEIHHVFFLSSGEADRLRGHWHFNTLGCSSMFIGICSLEISFSWCIWLIFSS